MWKLGNNVLESQEKIWLCLLQQANIQFIAFNFNAGSKR